MLGTGRFGGQDEEPQEAGDYHRNAVGNDGEEERMEAGTVTIDPAAQGGGE